MTMLSDLLHFYHLIGLKHRHIQAILQEEGYIMSLSTLRRRLSELRLFRRTARTDLLDVAVFIQEHLEEYGMLHGYRLMHLRCIQAGMVVSQHTVRHLIGILDPEGVELRLRRRLRRRRYENPGPNFLWHVDSYDKLKPYGICINGAVDGFSRMMIWLHAFSTNSNPKVIAGYFLNEVYERQGTPARVRTDMGTENSIIRQLQQFLRSSHEDSFSNACYITGSSNHNQRIEQWWGFLRQHHAQYWMNLFQLLKDRDQFSGDFLDKNLLQFACLEVIQKELQEVAHLWNTHTIRSSLNANSPRGKPFVMYRLPQLYGCTDHLKKVTNEQIELCREECLPRGPHPCDETVFELGCLAMADNHLHPPTSAEEAIELYLFLRDYVHMCIR